MMLKAMIRQIPDFFSFNSRNRIGDNNSIITSWRIYQNGALQLYRKTARKNTPTVSSTGFLKTNPKKIFQKKYNAFQTKYGISNRLIFLGRRRTMRPKDKSVSANIKYPEIKKNNGTATLASPCDSQSSNACSI